MPVKYWSSAGLILTYRCTARCASCYLSCGPEAHEEMSVETALTLWDQFAAASPHGCRIHLTGGEPFTDWPRLLEVCRRAQAAGLAAPQTHGPLAKVETNAFWATDDDVVRQRVAALAQCGMHKLAISADPYHQQYVPIERCRRAARIAEELLGAERVQVRWRDWLATGFDTDGLSPAQRAQWFARYAAAGRDRLGGRMAAAEMAGPLDGDPSIHRKPPAAFADNDCRESLLRSRGVHADGAGHVTPGTCAGLIIGRVRVNGPQGGANDAVESIAQLWARLNDDHAARTVLGVLARSGPAGLAASWASFRPAPDGYAGKCQLCWDIRRQATQAGQGGAELGPAWMYGDAMADGEKEPRSAGSGASYD